MYKQYIEMVKNTVNFRSYSSSESWLGYYDFIGSWSNRNIRKNIDFLIDHIISAPENIIAVSGMQLSTNWKKYAVKQQQTKKNLYDMTLLQNLNLLKIINYKYFSSEEEDALDGDFSVKKITDRNILHKVICFYFNMYYAVGRLFLVDTAEDLIIYPHDDDFGFGFVAGNAAKKAALSEHLKQIDNQRNFKWFPADMKSKGGEYFHSPKEKQQKMLKEFAGALKYGSGKAYWMLLRDPYFPVHDLLLDAALHNYDLDPQCNGDRAQYVRELIAVWGGGRVRLIKDIVRRFKTDDFLITWDADQLFRLLCPYAADEPAMKNALKQCYARRPVGDSAFGFDSMSDNWGLEGVEAAIKVIGKHLLSDPDDWLNDSIYEYWDKWRQEHPEIDFDWRGLLDRLAASNPAADAFRSAMKRREAELEAGRKKHVKSAPYGHRRKDILEAIRVGLVLRGRFVVSARFAGELRQMLMTETRPGALATICQVLHRSKHVTARLESRLLELCSGTAGSNLLEHAVNALGDLRSCRIHDFAIKSMANESRDWMDFLPLLTKNWMPGDEKIVMPRFNKLRNEDNRHRVINNFRDSDCLPNEVLETFFRRCTCGNCKSVLVRHMIANGGLSEEFKAELAHDSQPEVREQLREEIKKERLPRL